MCPRSPSSTKISHSLHRCHLCPHVTSAFLSAPPFTSALSPPATTHSVSRRPRSPLRRIPLCDRLNFASPFFVPHPEGLRPLSTTRKVQKTRRISHQRRPYHTVALSEEVSSGMADEASALPDSHAHENPSPSSASSTPAQSSAPLLSNPSSLPPTHPTSPSQSTSPQNIPFLSAIRHRFLSFLTLLLDAARAEAPPPRQPPRVPHSQTHDRFKVQRRITVGFIMGAVVISFVFSSRWVFTLGMLAISLTGLFEYYRMVAAKGHLPAYKMGLCVTAATMIASASSSQLADVVFPVGGTFICIYLLFRRSKIATIADISTTFMGLFYAGYLPSYWIRLHEFTPHAADNVVASAVGRAWPLAPVGLRPKITVGSLLVFWTWLAAASADIGAFFVGRTYGRTRFSNISPKKTVEGAVAGSLCSAGVSILGAYLLGWPVWWATGAVYGVTVGVLGLCGDLFESCFKRDVGWKDSGSLFPGHGGMLDRADSYVLVGPLVYFFATLVLPMITRVMR